MPIVTDEGLSWLNRAVISGRIIPYLVLMTLAIMLLAAITVHVLSPAGLHDVRRRGVVGGADRDHRGLRRRRAGRRAEGASSAGSSCSSSVATVSLVTAVVTAGFVAYQQRRLSGETERHQELRETLARIEERIETLER